MDYSVYEIKDIQANTLAINCSGTYAVLGGRRELLLINLNNIEDRKKVSLQTRWETSAAQWNPCDQTKFATARNNRGDLYTWVDGKLSYAGNLKGHVRSISSIDWCPHDVNRLATSSVDSFRAICIWDTRGETKRPVLSFESVSGASNFRWNQVSKDIFATAHESDVRLWDVRKGPMPVNYVAAHVAKVWDIDWCPKDSSEFVTCSQDCKIKLWSTKNLKCPNFEASSNGIPLFRARYTPFGRGVVTTPTPYRRQDDIPLLLWSIYQDGLNVLMPISGHSDVVLGFQWRQNPSGDYELWTWSRDQNLRMCRPIPETLVNCGVTLSEEQKMLYNNDSKQEVDQQSFDRSFGDRSESDELSHDATVIEVTTGMASTSPKLINNDSQFSRIVKPNEEHNLASSGSLTPSGSVNVSVTPISTNKLSDLGEQMATRGDQSGSSQISSVPDVYISLMKRSPSASKSLQQEVSLLSSNPQYELEEMDYKSRRGCVRINAGSLQVRLQVIFTERYPADRSPPVFNFLNSTIKLSPEQIDKLMKILHETSSEAMQFSPNCLELCIRRARDLLEVWQKENPYDSLTRETGGNAVNNFRAFVTPSDMTVPFPRTCGGRITPSGCLLRFKSNGFEFDGPTPRSLYDVAARCSSGNLPLDHLVYSSRHSPPGDSYSTSSLKKRTHKNSTSSTSRRRSPAIMNTFQRSKSHCLSSPSCNPPSHPDASRNRTVSREDALEGKCSFSPNENQLMEGTKVPSDPNVYWTASLSAKPSDEEILTTSKHESFTETETQTQSKMEPLSVVPPGNDPQFAAPHSKSSFPPSQTHGQLYGSRPIISTATSPKSLSAVNNNGQKKKSNRSVYIYDISLLMLSKRQLAIDYVILPHKIQFMCTKNAEVATSSGRKDLIQFWQYCQILSDPKLCPTSEPSVLPPWAILPFGRKMIHSWIHHFSLLKDVQSLAMLAAVVIAVDLEWNGNMSVASVKPNRQSRGPSLNFNSFTNNYSDDEQGQKPYHTITVDNKLGKQMLQNIRTRSNSCTKLSDDDLIFMDGSLNDKVKLEPVRKAHLENMRLIDDALLYRLSQYIRCYGNLLYAWQLIVERTQILRLLPPSAAGPISGYFEDSDCSVQLQVRCHRCHADSTVGNNACCSQCRSGGPVLTCALCNLSVRGLATLCPSCHHGGHTEHIMAWFSLREVCPTGCGCQCLSLAGQITGVLCQSSFNNTNGQELLNGRFHTAPTKNIY